MILVLIYSQKILKFIQTQDSKGKKQCVLQRLFLPKNKWGEKETNIYRGFAPTGIFVYAF